MNDQNQDEKLKQNEELAKLRARHFYTENNFK